jgi:hypothetical protein
MKNLQKILKESLHKKYQINESFEKIFLNENNDVRFNSTIKVFGKLIDEGYDNEQINDVVIEQFDWLKNLIYTPGDTKGKTTGEKIVSTAEHGAISQFQEFLIRKVLSML